jgi:hypothetical protein
MLAESAGVTANNTDDQPKAEATPAKPLSDDEMFKQFGRVQTAGTAAHKTPSKQLSEAEMFKQFALGKAATP